MKPSMLAAAVLVFGLCTQAVAGNQPSSAVDPSSVGDCPGTLDGPCQRDGEPGAAVQRATGSGPGQPASAGGAASGGLFQAIHSPGGRALPAWSQDHRLLRERDGAPGAGSVAGRSSFFF
ncbi:hypothetical protein [Azotobacter salinestris]|uniref:hypothetical protein n=1 Tax=Azotobacter salinestris TaxID=69964 RepID=UPI0032DE96D3